MRQVSDDSQAATAQRSLRPTVSLSGWARRQWSGLHPAGVMADRKLQEAGRVMGSLRAPGRGGETTQKLSSVMLAAGAKMWSASPEMVRV